MIKLNQSSFRLCTCQMHVRTVAGFKSLACLFQERSQERNITYMGKRLNYEKGHDSAKPRLPCTL